MGRLRGKFLVTALVGIALLAYRVHDLISGCVVVLGHHVHGGEPQYFGAVVGASHLGMDVVDFWAM